MRLAILAFGAVLLGSSAALGATNCPQFLVKSGYADICSPGAWMAFRHGNDDNKRLIKRRAGHVIAVRPAKIKIRPRPGRTAAAK